MLANIRFWEERAKLGKYAIPHFNVWNAEMLMGVMDAAEELKAPVIISFGTGFVGNTVFEDFCWMMKSMAETISDGYALAAKEGKTESNSVRIISPMRGLPREIADGTEEIVLEDALREACRRADLVIADPLYARLLPEEPGKFIKLPHVAYSGRFYEKEIPVLVGERFDMWLSEHALCHLF